MRFFRVAAALALTVAAAPVAGAASTRVPVKPQVVDPPGHVTITAPRTLVPFVRGMVIEDPHADSRALVVPQTGHYLGFLDTTAEGNDYRIKG